MSVRYPLFQSNIHWRHWTLQMDIGGAMSVRSMKPWTTLPGLSYGSFRERALTAISAWWLAAQPVLPFGFLFPAREH